MSYFLVIGVQRNIIAPTVQTEAIIQKFTHLVSQFCEIEIDAVKNPIANIISMMIFLLISRLLYDVLPDYNTEIKLDV
jgi:hypothetical protein